MKAKPAPRRSPPRRQLLTVSSSPAAKPKDTRPISIVGYIGDRLVAEDKTDSHGKADQIAANWRESGLDVAIVEKTIAQD